MVKKRNSNTHKKFLLVLVLFIIICFAYTYVVFAVSNVSPASSNKLTGALTIITGLQTGASAGGSYYCGAGVGGGATSDNPLTAHAQLETQAESANNHCPGPACIDCPPKCPIPDITPIDQPGDGGGGGGGGGGSGGGGGGGGSGGSGCDPGAFGEIELGKLSDDKLEREGLMQDEFDMDNMFDYAMDQLKDLGTDLLTSPNKASSAWDKYKDSYEWGNLIDRMPPSLPPAGLGVGGGRPPTKSTMEGFRMPGERPTSPKMAEAEGMAGGVGEFQIGGTARGGTRNRLSFMGRVVDPSITGMQSADLPGYTFAKEEKKPVPEAMNAAELEPIITDGFVEIHNPLNKQIRLAGYELRDHTGNIRLYFPNDAVIGPNEYQVIAFSPLFEQNFGVEPNYVFDGFSVEKFKGTAVLAYNGQKGFKYVDYVRYGERSKPMYIPGDTFASKQRFIPINIEEDKEVVISEVTVDYSSKVAFIEIVYLGQGTYSLAGHSLFVYAGEDYYEGDIGSVVLESGVPFVFTFDRAGKASEFMANQWLCQAGIDSETGLCSGPIMPPGTRTAGFSDLKNPKAINHAGLVPRIEVVLSRDVCDVDIRQVEPVEQTSFVPETRKSAPGKEIPAGAAEARAGIAEGITESVGIGSGVRAGISQGISESVGTGTSVRSGITQGITESIGSETRENVVEKVSASITGLVTEEICFEGRDPVTGECRSPPTAEEIMEKYPSARPETPVKTISAKPKVCKAGIIDHFLKELGFVPYSGIETYVVSEQKLLRGSVDDRSGDFVESIPSLGFVEGFSDEVIASLVTPGKRYGEEKGTGRPTITDTGKASFDKDSVLPVTDITGSIALTTAGVADTIKSEIQGIAASMAQVPVKELAISPAAVTAELAVSELSDEELREAQQEFFETPCETILREDDERRGISEKPKSVRERIEDFDVDAELEKIIEELKAEGIDLGNPDVYKKEVGTVHSKLVEKLFETVREENFLITDWKADHNLIKTSFFSYSIKKQIEDVPIVNFDYYFDWRQRLITLNDFFLNSDYAGLDLEEKLFDVSRAVLFKIGYDYKIYSLVDDALSAYRTTVKFGGVPAQDKGGIRVRLNNDEFMSVIKGIGAFSTVKHMNGYVQPYNNLDKITEAMKELKYKEPEINLLLGIIEKYPVPEPPGPKTLEIPDDYDEDYEKLVDACRDAANSMSDLNRELFGEPILSFQRVDFKEGIEFALPAKKVITRMTEAEDAYVSSPSMSFGGPSRPAVGGSRMEAMAVAEIASPQSFIEDVRSSRISALQNKKPQLYENVRKGIDKEKSLADLNNINKEVFALSPGTVRELDEISDTLPGGMAALELRNPAPASSSYDSLTDIVTKYTGSGSDEICQEGACGASVCWKGCAEKHILITEIFPGTFSSGETTEEVPEPVSAGMPEFTSYPSPGPADIYTASFDYPEGYEMVPKSLEHGTGENGLVGHDETSEDVDNTWDMLLANPGTGPGEEPYPGPEPSPYPGPRPPSWPRDYPPGEDPVDCGYVSNPVRTERLNPQYTDESMVIPAGYDIIKGPFSMECEGDSFDFSFDVPDNYKNVKVLRCRGTMCIETILSETPVEELWCDGEPVSSTIGDEIIAVQPALDPLMLDVFFDVEKPINEADRRISTRGYSVEFSQGGFDARILTPDNYVSLPSNSHYYVAGAPFIVEAIVPNGTSVVITMPLVPRENYDGYGIFVLTGGEWIYLDSKIDLSRKVITAKIDDVNQFMVDGKVMFAVMSMFCHTCEGTDFRKVYDGGSKEAIVLVHGLTSTPSTWQFMISDYSLTRQPYQVWLFGYSASMNLDDASVALAMHLQNHSAEFNKIHLVGHSLGGMIIQQAAYFGSLNKYSFVNKVKKEILLGTPNLGSPAAELYDKLRSFLINSRKVAGVYFINPAAIKDVLDGRNIPRVNGIKYYVVAGTKTYPFSLGYFDYVNDGIVTTLSARTVGGIECNDMCDDYFEINVTHTELASHPFARKLIEKIISMEDAEQNPDSALVGYNQYGHAWIDECGSSDRFVIVGQKIPESETPGVLDCMCGNGVCGEGETIWNCPGDCAYALSAWLCPWVPVAVPLILLIVIILSCVYLITKYWHKKEINAAWKTMDYVFTVIGVVLLLLGMLVCNYISLTAIIIIAVIIILLLLDLFFEKKGGITGKAAKTAAKKVVKKKK